MTASLHARGLASSPPSASLRYSSVSPGLLPRVRSVDGSLHSLSLAVADCCHASISDFAALVTRADRPIPTCLAPRSSHSFSQPGSYPALSNRSSDRLYLQLPHQHFRDKRCQYGDRDLKALFTSSEDEAAAPAFPPDWVLRGQGSTAFIFSTNHFEASSRECIRRIEPSSRQWRDQRGK